MSAVSSALVIGGGAAGSTVAALLADAGIAVDLVEINPGVSALGSGLTVQANALRVLADLGVWPQVAAAGYGFDSLGLRAPDPAGTLLTEFADVRTGGRDLPATVGIYRPDLARILVDRAVAAGVNVRFATTVTALVQDEDGVDVVFDDESQARYGLVVGADGVRSKVRELIGVTERPQPVGMGIWRALTARPASVTRTDLYYGGPCFIAGYCPTGPDTMYCYLVERAQDRSRMTEQEQAAVMRDLSQAYHGPWDDIRVHLVPGAARVKYTHFETHVVSAPWNRGRVVLIGDAAHSCPPTVAQGAAQALEDAAVLAELVAAAESLDGALWSAFTARRYERVRTVVEGSTQICRWLLAGERGDLPGIMARVTELVSRPA